MKASLKNYHQAPRKVRLVVDAIRGKSVPQAKRMLGFMPQYAASAIEKLLDSAVANARTSGASAEQLFVKTIAVNKGLMSKRGRPFARGRSGVIRKTMSHVSLELGTNQVPGARGQVSGKQKKTDASSKPKPRT